MLIEFNVGVNEGNGNEDSTNVRILNVSRKYQENPFKHTAKDETNVEAGEEREIERVCERERGIDRRGVRLKTKPKRHTLIISLSKETPLSTVSLISLFTYTAVRNPR